MRDHASINKRCVLGCAHSCLRGLCCPVSVLAARRVLRSDAGGGFLVPRVRLAIVRRGPFRSVSMEWSPLWAAFLADGPPFQMLHLFEVLLFFPLLAWNPP